MEKRESGSNSSKSVGAESSADDAVGTQTVTSEPLPKNLLSNNSVTQQEVKSPAERVSSDPTKTQYIILYAAMVILAGVFIGVLVFTIILKGQKTGKAPAGVAKKEGETKTPDDWFSLIDVLNDSSIGTCKGIINAFCKKGEPDTFKPFILLTERAKVAGSLHLDCNEILGNNGTLEKCLCNSPCTPTGVLCVPCTPECNFTTALLNYGNAFLQHLKEVPMKLNVSGTVFTVPPPEQNHSKEPLFSANFKLNNNERNCTAEVELKLDIKGGSSRVELSDIAVTCIPKYSFRSDLEMLFKELIVMKTVTLDMYGINGKKLIHLL